MKKILVALSGGVDSAVAAWLLKEQGYMVAGAYMRTWMNEESNNVFADCPWERDRESAHAVADALGIDFEIVNLIEDYKKRVVSLLVDGYQNGLTPNPDILCNRDIKFGVFADYAKSQGFDGIATGHYCQKETNQDGSCDLYEGQDPNKDQSYFLALVEQKQLKNALFPVGGLEKAHVREKAVSAKLPNADRKDSQGICFLGDVPINDFLKQYIPDKPGDIVNHEGKIVGQHQGLHKFTLGQRKGINVPSNSDFNHYIVIKKDFKTNILHVAFDSPDTPGLFSHQVVLRDVHFINKPLNTSMSLLAKPRYRDPSQRIGFEPLPSGGAKIIFETPQRALAPGQVLALYDGKKLLGGGFYVSSYSG